jgi:tRNA threonylcarbamoyladenosine biosynthesis protein TsaB
VRVLAIESATAAPSVALVDGERVLAEHPAGPVGAHSERILPAIDALLRACGVGLDALDGFAIAIGPGSFTGLRVGLATLKGLAFGDPRPTAAVSTLAALARRAGDPRPEPVAALLDARRGELYAAAWPEGDAETPSVAEGLYRPEDLARLLPPRCRLVGEAAADSLGALQALAGPGIRLAPDPAGPGAGHVGVLGARLLRAGAGLPAAQLAPRYLRRAEAEARRTGRALEPP